MSSQKPLILDFSNLIEIMSHWKISDPLIFGIAWALKTELESGGLNLRSCTIFN